MFTLPLFLGLALGIRHAADADHVATIATVVIGRATLGGALRTAIFWGLGHSLTFFAVGLGIVLFGLELPPSFDLTVEILIGLSLLLLGVNQLLRSRGTEAGRVATAAPRHSRSLALGGMHGLAGSAAIALLALSTIGSRSEALVYLALFGVGTMLGMALITLLLAYSFKLSSSLAGAQRYLIAAAGVASCLVGLSIFGEMFVGE